MTATKNRGRYAAPRKPRNPVYILAALAAVGMLLLAGACSVDTEPDAPADFPVNAERRTGPEAESTTEPEPAVDEPAPVKDDPEPAPEQEPEPEESDDPFDSATVGELNALDSAISYLDFAGFSESGLIGQLEYEGYTAAEIEFAMGQIAPDWNAEAVESAESYLEFSSFSRAGLIDQLLYEGFTQAQAEHAVNQVGL